MMRHPLMAAALALALSGCASPTPYQPSATGGGYGYSEQRIEDDRFRVSFSGNSATERQTVKNYLLYRAAELTLAQGGDYFVVTARSDTPDYGAAGPSTSVGTGVGIGSGGMSSGWSIGMGVPVGGYGGGPSEASAEIVVHRGKKPAGAAEAYDARVVKGNLAPHVRRPAP
ncbi:MAG: hypothetical protein GEU92_02340 [Alphaproteobacteria bacterium]|nr:hypothetical protein [Alphaproteobacteria bacterium]